MTNTVIPSSSPISEALCAILATKEAVLCIEDLLTVKSFNGLMDELQFAVEELVDLHERSVEPTAAATTVGRVGS